MRKFPAAFLASGTIALALVATRQCGYTPEDLKVRVWYQSLKKPDFMPKAAVFGGAWAVLDILLCYAGYRLLTRAASRARAWALSGWSLLVAGLFLFPAVMFGHRRLGLGVAVTGGMLAASAQSVISAQAVDKKASFALTPFIGWLSFATILQIAVWRRNAR